jgi:hypothetical protein
MEFKTIKKNPETWKVPPNLVDYEKIYSEFMEGSSGLDGLPGRPRAEHRP